MTLSWLPQGIVSLGCGFLRLCLSQVHGHLYILVDISFFILRMCLGSDSEG